jgi:hypothetical protein
MRERISPRLLRLLPPERLLAWPEALRRRDEIRALGFAVLKAHQALDRLDEAEQMAARQAYLASTAWNLARLDRLDRLVEAARRAGLELVLLKGAAMARTRYGDAGARPMVDVDVLCAEDDLSRVVEVARSIGFAVTEPPAFRRAQKAVHDLKLHDGAVMIEVHHRLWHELGLGDDARGVRARAVETEVDGVRLRVPAVEDQLLITLVHAATHGFTGNPMWIIDALLLLDEAGPDALARAGRAARRIGGELAWLAARDHLSSLCPDLVPPAPDDTARLRRALVRRLGPWLQRGEPELGLWPSRLVRALLVDDPRAFGHWAVDKARLFVGRLSAPDW